MVTSYDYIVIGAGSSGCAFAAKLLSLLPDVKIALIESGEDYLNDAVKGADFLDPNKCIKSFSGPANKNYRTIPQKALNDRRIPIYRAAAIGGCSCINAMLWMRGFRQDWDDHMPKGFRSSDVEPEFEWLEDRLKPVLYTTNSLGEKAIQAAAKIGFGKEDESSRWTSPGTVSNMRISLDEEGRRQDIYRALGADDSRITLVKGMAERLIFQQSDDGGGPPHASGVVLRMKDGSTKDIITNESGEVILSCGAIDSPKLLQISGVGPADLMEKLDISLVLDSPNVGEGLKDHTMHVLSYSIPDLPEKFSPNGINASLYDDSLDVQYLFSDGVIAPHVLDSMLLEPYYSKAPSTTMMGKIKDFAMFVGMFLLSFALSNLVSISTAVRTKIQSSFTVSVNLMRPSSIGSVKIRSKDPLDAPLIDSAFLSTESDMETLLKGVTKARDLVQTSPLSEILGEELTPSGEDEKENIKNNCLPYHHSVGTCSDCLDEELRFRGIEGLRVVDASSLSFLPRVPTNASSMAIGARCASIIAAEIKN